MKSVGSGEANFSTAPGDQPGTPKRKEREGSASKEDRVIKRGKERGASQDDEMELEEEEDCLSENERKMWDRMLKKRERWYDKVAADCSAVILEAKQDMEKVLREKDKTIEDLEGKVAALEEAQMNSWMQGGEGIEGDGENGEDNAEGAMAWSKVVSRRVKEKVLEVMDDRKVKRKLARVTEEVKEEKDKERNVIIRGWKEALAEGEGRDVVTVTKAVLGRKMNLDVEIEQAAWYGKDEEKKVLMVKLKSRDGKKEVMENKKKLRGTRIFVDDDLPREDRIITQKLMELKAKIKAKNKDMDVWVRRRSIKVEGKWYTWEEVKRGEGNFQV